MEEQLFQQIKASSYYSLQNLWIYRYN
jgi:hypothetical protein